MAVRSLLRGPGFHSLAARSLAADFAVQNSAFSSLDSDLFRSLITLKNCYDHASTETYLQIRLMDK
jgi:hypothetical protein